MKDENLPCKALLFSIAAGDMRQTTGLLKLLCPLVVLHQAVTEMTSKSIFIASAIESKPYAMAIAHELNHRGYHALRWWEQFPPGSITIDCLIELTESVAGAVLICSGIDKLWYRSELVSMPRDNVIFEYALFLKRLGKEKALLLTYEQAF